MGGTTLALFAPDPRATDAIGAALAEAIVPGDVILLSGELGAGKSALARALIRARLADRDLDVPSPSFALVQPYPGLVHADLYRLADASEIEELGLLDDVDAVLLVEWPERAPDLARLPGLSIALAIPPGGEGRSLALTVRGDRDALALRAALRTWTIGP